MPLFFAPPVRSTVPPVLPEGDPEQSDAAFRLYRFFRNRPAGVNVYFYKPGSLSALAHGRVSEDSPITLYDSMSKVTSTGWEDIELVAWGGHDRVQVTSSQAAALTAAGYTIIAENLAPTDPPVILALSPTSGIAGTVVTVVGTALDTTTGVSVDGTAVAFTVMSSVQITFTTPTHIDSTITVVVTNPNGSDSRSWTYVTPVVGAPPAITAVTPATGQANTIVVLSGTGFSAVTSVKFDTASASFTVNSPTQITATAPVHADGAISITVTSALGTSNTEPWTYVPAVAADPHPGADILAEDGSYILAEDGTSSILQEG